MPKTGLAGGSYTTQSRIADSSRTINLYPELIESARGPAGAVLYSTPGYTLFATGLAGFSRGHFNFNGRLYTVAGNTVYELNPSTGAILTTLGIIDSDSQQCTIFSNRYQIMILSAGKGYVITPADNVLTLIADVDFPGNLPNTRAIDGDYEDGYGFVLADNNFFYISSLNDFTAWDQIDTSTIQFFSEKLRAMLIDHREVFVFARPKGQVLYNSGDPDFPFTPVAQGLIEYGVTAIDTLIKSDNSFIFLGEGMDGSGIVYRVSGYDPRRISDHGVEHRIQRALKAGNNLDLSVAWSYQIEGHSFYVLNIPGMDTCPVYDGATKLWHEIAWWNVNTGLYEPHRGINHIYINGKHLIGDRALGKIYELDLETYTDNGDIIRRVRQHPQITADGRRLVHDRLRILMDTGVGLNVAEDQPGYDPQLMMEYSDDGGITFENLQSTSIGKIGEYDIDVEFPGLGSTNLSRVYRLIGTDPVPYRFIESYLNPRLGA